MKKAVSILIVTLLLPLVAGARQNSTKLGENNLFMPKGAISVGLQGSYLDLSGSDASIMVFLERLNATGSYSDITPYFCYTYMDNRSVGLKFKYSNAVGALAGLQLSLPGSDMQFEEGGISAQSTGYMAEAFHRSYMGLDGRGRFGLFLDLALQYSSNTGHMGKGSAVNGNFTRTHKIKAAVRPGLEVFVMNNVSSVFSLGIGGVSYSNSKNYTDGTVSGTSSSSKARFMPDITDLSMGIAVHF